MNQDNLWTPWRGEYVGTPKTEGCVFCHARDHAEDPDALVVFTGARMMVILNRFPYTSGHLMVLPLRHIARLDELTMEEWAEAKTLLDESQAGVTALYHPQGFNVGINLGEAAGAGIAAHLHIHLVPRWKGDTNFLPIMADLRVIPHHLTATREDLAAWFAANHGKIPPPPPNGS